jgi:serine/threonine protein phosphatase PrpC
MQVFRLCSQFFHWQYIGLPITCNSIQAGDIVVLGTDGLFDNLSDKVQHVCVCVCERV